MRSHTIRYYVKLPNLSEEICSVPEQHCADKRRTGRRFFTCPNFYCCPKGVVTCTRADASELIHGNCELVFLSTKSLASNVRHCCTKEHERESKDLKMTLTSHESSLTIKNPLVYIKRGFYSEVQTLYMFST